MDVNSFEVCLKYLAGSGYTLGTEKSVLLQNTMTILQNENHFHKIFLWGQLLGLQADYYIAFGYEKDALYGRIFYYSTDCLNWGLLPKPTAEHRMLALTCSSRFQGDPAYVETIAKDAPATTNETELDYIGAEGAGGEGQELPTETARIKEEDRLAGVVQLISEEAMIVPRGALIRRQDGYIVANQGFGGLDEVEARDKCNLFHFRPPLNRWNTNLLQAEGNYNFSLDFLDSIDRDLPNGKCWSLQMKAGGSVLLIRNLYWPGTTFFHRLQSPDYGFLYVGFGRREIDLPFML